MKYKVLLLGLGFFGRQWWEHLSKDEECEIVAATGGEASVKKIEEMGYQVNIPVYRDYREAIEKTDADFVVIVLPTQYHTDAAKRAIARGMHVLSEKPLTINRDDALDALKYCKERETIYMIDQNYRWRPHNQAVRNLLQSGIIGDIKRIELQFRRPEDLIGYRTDLEMPLLQDVSIHHFDLIRFFTGKNCRRIYARSYCTPWSKFKGQASSDVMLEMDDGLFVNYTGTWAGRGDETTWDGTFRFMGEKGSLLLNESSEIWFFPADNSPAQKMPVQSIEYEEIPHAIDDMKKAIKNGCKPETNIEDNIHSFLMHCAAYESAKKNEWVDCE